MTWTKKITRIWFLSFDELFDEMILRYPETMPQLQNSEEVCVLESLHVLLTVEELSKTVGDFNTKFAANREHRHPKVLGKKFPNLPGDIE